jgi:hypothetical protein
MKFKSVSEPQAVLLSITDVRAPEQHVDDESHLLSEEAYKEESDQSRSLWRHN